MIPDQIKIIGLKLAQLDKMREYLRYSLHRMQSEKIAFKDMKNLTPQDAEAFAAFRIRFSEYQEHLGKLAGAIAREEGISIIGTSDLASFAEKIGLVETESDWKKPRDIRNAINHEYHEDSRELSELVHEMIGQTDRLFSMHDRAAEFCLQNYPNLPAR